MSWSIPEPDDAAILRAKHTRYPDDTWPTPSWTCPEPSRRAEAVHDEDDEDIWCTD